MFCKYCGKDLSDDAVFCSGCGKRLVMEVKEKIAVEEKLNYEPPSVGQVTEQTIEKSDANETDVVKFDPSAKELEEVAAVSDGADKMETSVIKNEEVVVSNFSPNMQKVDTKKNDVKKSWNSKKTVFITAIAVVIIIFCSIGIMLSQNKNPWVSDDTFNLDILKCEQKTACRNDGGLETANCYKISRKAFEKLWTSLPKKIIYGEKPWYPFSPKYDYIGDYNSSWQVLMYQYDILCSPIYQYSDGSGNYMWTYVVNRKTGQVMAF